MVNVSDGFNKMTSKYARAEGLRVSTTTTLKAREL